MYLPEEAMIGGIETNLLQYLGEEGEDCQIKAAVLCASPWNLDVSSATLQQTWIGREVYSKTMGNSMKALFER